MLGMVEFKGQLSYNQMINSFPLNLTNSTSMVLDEIARLVSPAASHAPPQPRKRTGSCHGGPPQSRFAQAGACPS